MNYQFSRKALGLKPSATALRNDRVMQKNSAGAGIVNLTVGQPDFSFSAKAVNIAKEVLEKYGGANKYAPVSGLSVLKQTILWKKRADGQAQEPAIDEKNIFVSAGGAKQALNMLLTLFLNEGDKALVFSPYWVSYPEMIAMAGGTTVEYPLLNYREEINWTLLQAVVGHGSVKVIILNNPTNPTGRVWSREELTALGKIAIENNCLVLSDDVYEAFVYDRPFRSLSRLFPENGRNFISVNSFSKTYAMMGYRIGYVLAEEDIVKRLSAVQSQLSSGATTFGQYLAADIVYQCGDEVVKMKREFSARREIATIALRNAGLEYFPPAGAFYVFFKVPEGRFAGDAVSFCDELENNGVAMVPGDESGAPGYVRMCYAASRENLKEGLRRLEEFVQK